MTIEELRDEVVELRNIWQETKAKKHEEEFEILKSMSLKEHDAVFLTGVYFGLVQACDTVLDLIEYGELR